MSIHVYSLDLLNIYKMFDEVPTLTNRKAVAMATNLLLKLVQGLAIFGLRLTGLYTSRGSSVSIPVEQILLRHLVHNLILYNYSI